MMTNKHILTAEEILEQTYKKGKAISGSDAEMLPVFSEKGVLLGIAPRLLCHRLGLIHKVVYLFITNSNNELLLQTRNDGRLDVPVGGHFSANDSSEIDALLREAKEELGISLSEDGCKYLLTYFQDAELNPSKPEVCNRELRVLYTAFLSEEKCKKLKDIFKCRRDKDAVKSIEWFSVSFVKEMCKEGKAASGLKHSLPYYQP